MRIRDPGEAPEERSPELAVPQKYEGTLLEQLDQHAAYVRKLKENGDHK